MAGNNEKPVGFPFNAVDEFKEYMQKELDNICDDSFEDLSVNSGSDKKSCDKENSAVLDDEIEDVLLSYPINSSPPLTRSTVVAKRSKRNLRSNKQSQAVETVLVGDAEEDDVSCETHLVNQGRGRRKRSSRRIAEASPRKIVSSNDCVVIDDDDDDDDVCKIVEPVGCEKIGSSRSIDVDVINEEINVKISWNGEPPIKIKIRKYEAFSKIFSTLADEKKVDVKCVVLLKNDVKIKPEDTPDSINLNILDILSGYTVSKPAVINKSYARKVEDPNALEVKVISDITDSKKIKELFFTINKGQMMLVLYVKIAEQLNLTIDDIQLWFDGEKVNEKNTTVDLDLEGGECFELKYKIR